MRKKLLLVEDNTDLLELLRLGLKDFEFLVSTASDGLEALRKARSSLPDIIILDLVLPEVDGFAVCEALKRDPETARIPIIALTGLVSQFSKLASLEVGADEYVTKPVTINQLVSTIERCLSNKSLRATQTEQFLKSQDKSVVQKNP